jgi:gamma-glutamyltranspeptidase/glutathione hydrolase
MEDGGTVNLESGIDYAVIRELMERGHRIEWSSGPFGGYQAILLDAEREVYYGASESRKDGQAAGY